MGLVGRTLMGKSQLKVSTSICSTPVQVTASDWLPRTKQVPADSPEVTNSKCSLHFRDTMLVVNPGVELSGMGRLKLLCAVCRQDS